MYVLYRDIRTYGFKESYYTKARQQGVVFVRYDEDRKPEVSRNGEGLKVTVYDQTLGMPIMISADLVVLSAGIHPHEDNQKIAQFLKVPLNSEGFFLEAHMKLRPVDFMTDGVFLVRAGPFSEEHRGIHSAGSGSVRASGFRPCPG